MIIGQVMSWCCQTTSHYLNLWWFLKSISPNCISRYSELIYLHELPWGYNHYIVTTSVSCLCDHCSTLDWINLLHSDIFFKKMDICRHFTSPYHSSMAQVVEIIALEDRNLPISYIWLSIFWYLMPAAAIMLCVKRWQNWQSFPQLLLHSTK